MKIRVRRVLGVLTLGFLIPACGFGGNGTLTPSVAPGAPTGLAAIGAPLRAALSWIPSPAATSYTVKRSLVSGGPYIPVSSGSGISAPSFVDRGLANGTTYYYVVSAANFYGQSSDSSEVKVIPSFNVALLSAGTSPASRVSLAVLKDGSLWGWGSNQNLLLGPTTSNALSTVAFEISTPFTHPISSISTSGMHALALTSDGTVWAWGSNQFGELGNGTQSTAAPFNLGSPSPVSTLAGVIAIAAGGNHSLALKSDGTVWGWGDNSAGQLGNGTTTLSPTPVQVSMLTGIIAIAAGENHSLALTSDGYVWAWGLNTNGQLGNGTTTSLGVGQSSPVQVSALTGVAGISAGYAFSMALGRDGTVWVWGDGGHGELGNGTFASSPLRTQVLGLGEMTAVSAGSNHCLALQSDGTVWSWGFNLTGQLGNGTVSNITPYGLSSPGQVVSLTGVTAISGGGAHSLALRSDGSLVAWGDDDVGELGNGSGAVQVLPVAIPDLTNVLTISAGGGHSLAVDTNGKVWAWGDNTSGELGISSATQSLFPVLTSQQTGLGPVKAIAAGASFSMALVTNGAVWAWGDNFSGQLGNGSTTAQALVGLSTPEGVAGVSLIVAISAGASHSLALTSSGTVWAWGYNQYGQVGNGTFTTTSPYAITSPVQVSALTGVTAIAGGGYHSLALKSDGTVWAWGNNVAGQLGNGTTSPTMPPFGTDTPGQVSALTGITAIAAGGSHSLALKSDGTVWAWGYNMHGQIGTGTATSSGINTPVQVSAMTGVTAITAGENFSVALKSDGTVWAWGENGAGQLGNGTTTDGLAPIQVPSVSGVTAISSCCSGGHCLALLPNHTCIGWGDNAAGQLGSSPTNFSAVPIEVTH